MKDDEKYFDNYYDLFLTEGWKQFVAEATDSYSAIVLDNCKDWDSFLISKTMRKQLKAIIDFESLIRAAKTNSEQEEDIDAL